MFNLSFTVALVATRKTTQRETPPSPSLTTYLWMLIVSPSTQQVGFSKQCPRIYLRLNSQLLLSVVVARGSYRGGMESQPPTLPVYPPQNREINTNSGVFDYGRVEDVAPPHAKRREFSSLGAVVHDPSQNAHGIIGAGASNMMTATGMVLEYPTQREQDLQGNPPPVQASNCQCHTLHGQVIELTQQNSYYKEQAIRF
jgi:hypothetical protein